MCNDDKCKCEQPKIEVTIISEEQAVEVGINPAAYVGKPGKSPKIGEDGYWYIWDNETNDWVNTEVFARGGISDYEDLTNKPKINGVELTGDRSSEELSIENFTTNSDIDKLFEE